MVVRRTSTVRASAAGFGMGRAIRIGCASLLALAISQPLRGQNVTGNVTRSPDGAPLTGVHVYLANASGLVVSGGLTDAEGRYVLRAEPGAYDLHAELIGHVPFIARSVRLLNGETVHLDAHMAVRAIDLEGITVSVESRCRSGPPAAPVTARLWEEARTALRVTRWSEENGALRFQLARSRRELDPRSLEIRGEETRNRTGYFDGSPYTALPAERLAENGFVTTAPDGTLEYWAPDAAVLLSESFLENHCFRLASGRASEPALVGLAFEPVAGRSTPEIEGVLWLDAETQELRRLDFSYVNLPYAGVSRLNNVGGRVEFQRLSNGMWIVSSWRIRMPILAARRPVRGALSDRRLEVASLTELRGEVLRVVSRGGETLAQATGATLFGSVHDVSTGRALSGAQIALLGTAHHTASGDSGHYRFTDLPDGVYTVRFRHPALAELDLTIWETQSVTLGAGTATRLQLPVSAEGSLGAACRTQVSEGFPVLTYGIVRDSAGIPLRNAVVLMHTPAGDRPQVRSQADSSGSYYICSPPTAGPARLAAVPPGRADAAVPDAAWIDADASVPGFQRVDLVATTLPVADAASQAIPLGELRVTARRQGYLEDVGFYKRQERGLGWFVDSDEVDRRNPFQVTDLVRGASGVVVIPRGGFEYDIRLPDATRLLIDPRDPNAGDCPPTVYVDGMKVRSSPRRDPPITQLVDAASIAALEVLRRPSEIPPEYGGAEAACGVVLVWRRR